MTNKVSNSQFPGCQGQTDGTPICLPAISNKVITTAQDVIDIIDRDHSFSNKEQKAFYMRIKDHLEQKQPSFKSKISQIGWVSLGIYALYIATSFSLPKTLTWTTFSTNLASTAVGTPNIQTIVNKVLTGGTLILLCKLGQSLARSLTGTNNIKVSERVATAIQDVINMIDRDHHFSDKEQKAFYLNIKDHLEKKQPSSYFNVSNIAAIALGLITCWATAPSSLPQFDKLSGESKIFSDLSSVVLGKPTIQSEVNKFCADSAICLLSSLFVSWLGKKTFQLIENRE